MIKIKHISGLILASTLSINAYAWMETTHAQIVVDAVKYMEHHPESTEYATLAAAAASAGVTVDQLALAMGQSAFDVDRFQDTYWCGVISGDCVMAPVYDLGSFYVNYSSTYHFQNHTVGGDIHGNDLGGYNYDTLTIWGATDTLWAGWVWNDHLDDGSGGKTGWWGRDDTVYDSYNNTEAHYRLDGYSTYSMYDDWQDAPFQPIDNLGQYWYNQYQAAPSVQSLGFVLHTTDLLQPHHTWTTLSQNHPGWEEWVEDYYFSEGFNDEALVEVAMDDFTPIAADSTDIRGLLTEGGAISYAQGGAVLNTTDHSARADVGRIMIPHAIAMAVHVINHAMLRLK